ncbi:MAG: DUF624 domain-containing protein [Candidatus Izimaplasma sp.]|nr:DUF624 domain-containing protein [Candidatus Izimaplasma bacterium]
MFEKLVNSKINIVADWIIRLIMINIMIVFFSLAVVTIYPAVSAGYNMLSDYIRGKQVKLFRGYIGYFKQSIGKKIVFQIIIIIIFVLAYTNIRYYTQVLETNQNIINILGYYVTLTLLAMTYAIILFSLVVMSVRPDLQMKSIVKMSFYLAGKFYFITLLAIIINGIPFFLLLLPQTIVVFVFMGISIPMTLFALLSKQAVIYLEQLGEKNG